MRLILGMWTEKRTTFQGKYFQAEDAILEPKPIQKPHPPVMIGGGEQLTLRASARLADACNVGGTPDMVRHKYDVLRRHCEAEGRNYDEIERATSSASSSHATRRPRCQAAGACRSDNYYGVAGTVSQITDLIGRYRDAGVQLPDQQRLQERRYETLELLAADVMPKVAS